MRPLYCICTGRELGAVGRRSWGSHLTSVAARGLLATGELLGLLQLSRTRSAK